MQCSIFDYINKPFSITKPIRYISLFCGIGTTEMALKRLGVNFEHYKAIDNDKYKIAMFNAIHGTNFTTTDITEMGG